MSTLNAVLVALHHMAGRKIEAQAPSQCPGVREEFQECVIPKFNNSEVCIRLAPIVAVDLTHVVFGQLNHSRCARSAVAGLAIFRTEVTADLRALAILGDTIKQVEGT